MTTREDAPRQTDFLLARHERRLLRWVAARLPARVKPDHLTALGVVAALAIAAAYVLSNERPAWLWVASALLVVHWLGDSLDGTLARVRGIERPRYGYYLDHLVDAFATVAICVGLGLSPHMLLATGFAIGVAYLILSINVYLETQAFGVFRLGYEENGATEARIALIALNSALALGAGLGFRIEGVGLTALDAFGLGIAAAMTLALVLRAAANLRRLAAEEPAAS